MSVARLCHSQLGIAYTVFVFNINRWECCQMQPRKFETKVKPLQIFNVKSLLKYFKSKIAKKLCNSLLHSISIRIKIILVAFFTNAILWKNDNYFPQKKSNLSNAWLWLCCLKNKNRCIQYFFLILFDREQRSNHGLKNCLVVVVV